MAEKADKPFSEWTVVELKSFLKAKGARCTGTKADLLHLANLYQSTDPVTIDSSPSNYDYEAASKIFQDPASLPP